MKRYLISAAVFSVSAVFLPLAVTSSFGLTGRGTASESGVELHEYIFGDESEDSQVYKVLDVSTGEVYSVPVREYVIGAVCAEMPASFGEEALKAQAVAAHTYAERRRLQEKDSPDPSLKGADFSNDTSKYQGYFTPEQIRERFGGSFEDSYGRISSAVDEVLPYLITYRDEPVIAAFHSLSSGRTESAENVWGTKVDYLVPVDSSADISAPKYLDSASFTRQELEERLKASFPSAELGGDMRQWVTVDSVSDSGTVISAHVGNTETTGNDIRIALGLRSACFAVEYRENEAVFTTRGFGHGVGMSQYGADAMAAQGSSWREILMHYYPHCEIKKSAD